MPLVIIGYTLTSCNLASLFFLSFNLFSNFKERLINKNTQKMKKLVLLSLCLMVGTFITTNAQGVFKAGVKGGLNIASIGGDSYYNTTSGIDYNSRIAFHIGGFLEVPLTEKFSFQPELLYSSQGSGYGAFGAFGFDDTNLGYVNVPLLGKYHIWNGISAEVGPVIGILVTANSDDDFYDPDFSDDNDFDDGEIDDKERYNTLDAGIAIGATYIFDFGLFAGLRFQKGILNIYDDRFTNAKGQNNVFQIFAGYSFL